MPFVDGVFVRVENSFSEPVVGTTIEPAAATALFDDYDDALTELYSDLADPTLVALAALDSTPGVVVQTAADTFTKRSIAGTTNQIAFLRGDGVSGNPTALLPYTPEQYGAVVDGTTNNTVQICMAAAAAATNVGGLRLVSQGGSYVSSPIRFGGTAPNSGTFTGSISTTAGGTLTVTTPPTIPLSIGQELTGAGVSTCTITGFGTGTGLMGTYLVSVSQTAASTTITVTAPTFNLAISGTAGTVSGFTVGKLYVGMSLSAAVAGTTITALGTSTGGNGTITVSYSQTLATTACRAYAFTTVALPHFIEGGGETRTVVLGDSAGGPYSVPLWTIYDPIVTSAVPYGFYIRGLRIHANSRYLNALRFHGYDYAWASDLFLQAATGFGMAVVADTTTGCIYADFERITSNGNAGGGFDWDGNYDNNGYNNQAIHATSLRAQSNTGIGWRLNYTNMIGIECSSESNTGLAMSVDNSNHLNFPDFYTEDCGGPVTGTANSNGFAMTGQVIDGVNATLLANVTSSIDTFNGATRDRNAGDVSATSLAALVGGVFSQGAISTATGYRVNGLAPLNNVLLGNGTNGIWSATLPTSVLTGVVSAANGGTGVANNAASTITISGSFGITFTITGTTNVAFGTGGTIGAVGYSALGQIAATATNDDAAAGKVGEYISTVVPVGSAVGLTSMAATNIVSQVLQPGDYEVSAAVVFNFGGTTNVTVLTASISETSATHGTSGVARWQHTYGASGFVVGGEYLERALPTVRVSVATATTKTVRLVATSVHTISTAFAWGSLHIRRVR
jgi:hypothetical protein